jgi:tetratricopeptide (TPR) repeat protein
VAEGERDGAAVQADLRSVIERAKDPRAVLGLAPAAGLPEARAAFHALCKRYHPARFARSSPETVRLANEAFLAIKRAYDGLVRPADAAPSKTSDSIPKQVADAPSGAVKVPATTAPIPRVVPATTKIPAVTAPIPRVPPAERATEKMPAQPRPPGPVRPTERVPAQPRVATQPVQKITPAEMTAMSEEQRFSAALDLLRRRLWKDAEKALGELAVSHATEKKYRAYRHYARGRMAQDEGRLDEARGEWERALRLEPDLNAARAAIDQLPEPPKPTGGGLLSRLFKR